MTRPRKEPFEMATREGYREIQAYVVGSFAIHNNIEAGYWKISHRATGFYTSIWGQTLKQAVEIAERLEGQADWTKVRRKFGVTPKPLGVTEAMASAVYAVRQDYPHLGDPTR